MENLDTLALGFASGLLTGVLLVGVLVRGFIRRRTDRLYADIQGEWRVVKYWDKEITSMFGRPAGIVRIVGEMNDVGQRRVRALDLPKKVRDRGQRAEDFETWAQAKTWEGGHDEAETEVTLIPTEGIGTAAHWQPSKP